MTINFIKSTFKKTAGVYIAPTLSSFNQKALLPQASVKTPAIITNPPSTIVVTPIALSASVSTVPLLPIMPIAAPTTGSVAFTGPISIVPSATGTLESIRTALITLPPATPVHVDDLPFFPPGSSLLPPVIEVNSEEFHGTPLTQDEKPFILATISTNVQSGVPDKNIIFVRPLRSLSKKVDKYIVYRKDLFSGADFVPIITQGPQDVVLATKYSSLFKDSPDFLSAGIVFEDEDIVLNKVYVYKIHIEWSFKSAAEMAPLTELHIPSGTLDALRLGFRA